MKDELENRLGDFLRAQRIVEAINKEVVEKGGDLELVGLKPLPKDLPLRTLDREAPGVALQAVVEALGGIPAMLRWALSDPKHAGKVYEWWVKTLPTESKVEHSGNLVIESSLDDSPFDDFAGDRNADHASH